MRADIASFLYLIRAAKFYRPPAAHMLRISKDIFIFGVEQRHDNGRMLSQNLGALARGELGRGLVAYDAGQLVGRNSRDIAKVLGAPGRSEMIHRDDMALGGE